MPRKRKGVTAAQQRERLKRQQNSSINGQLQTHQGESQQVNPIQTIDTCKVMSGTLHQGDSRFRYPGVQCAYISMMALVRMTLKDPKSWISEDIDSCVIDGNTGFLKHCETLDIQPKMLMANELPNRIKYSQKSFVCNQSDGDIEFGLLNPTMCGVDECDSRDLNRALSEKLTISQTCLLFCGGLTIAIAKLDNSFYTFDPHSRGKDGLLDPNGTAVLTAFVHLKDLICFIENLFLHSLNLQPSNQFELVSLNISQISIEKHEHLLGECSGITAKKSSSNASESLYTASTIPKQQETLVQSFDLDVTESMKSYFDDQRKRQKLFQESRSDHASTKMHKKNEYMKQYMKRRREKEIVKQKENEAAKIRMKRIRSTSEGKQTNKKRSVEGMRRLIQTEDGRLKHNQLSAETMRKRLCTEEGRQKHNKRSAESMKNMLKDDQKRLKHNKKSADAMRRMLTDEQKRQKHAEKSAEAMRRMLTDEQKRKKHTEKSAEAMRRMLTDEQKRQKHTEKSGEAMRRMLTDEQKRQKHTEKSAEAMRRMLRDEQKKEKHKERSVEAMKRLLTDEDKKQKHRQKSVDAKRLMLTDEKKKQEHRIKSVEAMKRMRTDEKKKQSDKEKSAESMRKSLQDEQKRQLHRKRTAEGMRKLLSVDHKRKEYREKSAQRMKNIRKRRHDSNKDYLLRKKRKIGVSFEKAVNNFNEAIKDSCSYVCSCCNQTWFKQSVRKLSSVSKSIDSSLLTQCVTGYQSVGNEEWICNTCLNNLRQGKIPRLSVVNGMKFPDQVPELKLNSLEERLISLRIPFMQIRTLNSGGQFSLKGSVVNVPTEIEPTIRALPRSQNESETIPMRLKRMKELKSSVATENVRPAYVLNALRTLTNTSDFYKEANISIDEDWSVNKAATENEISPNIHDCTDDDSDTFSEVEDEVPVVTFLDDQTYDKNTVLSVAPGEGQRPLSIFKDPDSEYLSFPTLFCGQKRIANSERHVAVYYSDICKWELRSIDRRVALHIPNLFYKMKKLQTEQVCNKVHLAVRRCKTKGKTYTAGFILNDNMGESLIRLDEGYRIFKTIRNSPQYWEQQKKDVFAMIRQLGIPTLFLSFSANDLHWSELIVALGKLVDNKDYTDAIASDSLSWEIRSRLVQSDPVTCVRHFDHRVSQFIQTILKCPNSPLGEMEDYFYRVEFQQRGSPHIHMLVWMKNSPRHGEDKEEDVIRYIDTVSSASAKVPSGSEKYLAMQRHKHSRTCRKGGKAECRFGIPFPPMRNTVILQPYDGDDRSHHEEHFKTVQKHLVDVECITFDDFLSKIELTESDYIKAVQTSITNEKVFLKRTPNENRINPYIKDMLDVWKGNHDIQYILDAYACAMYIVSYINKSAKGMSTLMAEACKEAKKGNQTLKQSVRHIGNKFLNAVEVSAQEAAYLILQQGMSLKSRGCEFIPTAPQSERTFLMKSRKELEALPDTSVEIEADNIVKRYSRRHIALEHYCLADFVSKVISVTANKTTQAQHENHDSPDDEADENSFVENDTSLKTRYSVTTGNYQINIRTKPKIIRYVRYNITTDRENYFREQLMLFYPWRNEEADLLGSFSTYEERIKPVFEQISETKKQYDASIEVLEKVEQAASESLTIETIEVSPNIESVEAKDADIEPMQSSKYVFYKPETREHSYYDLGADIGLATHLANDEIDMIQSRLPENEYLDLLSKLNYKQRQIFTHIIHSMTFCPERQLCLFITGGAGVGKSLLIRTLYQALHRVLCSESGQNPEDIRVQMCAYTGLAAYNINGSTLHSAFGIEPNKKLVYKPLSDEKRNTFQTKFMYLSVLIIDEVSMVGNGMLNFLYLRLQEIKANKKPFGGVHIILVGDLFQLRPVGDSWIFSDSPSGYATLAPNLWQQCFTMFELTEIMRQKDDVVFAELLNRIREGNQTAEDIDLLRTRSIKSNDTKYRELKNELHLFPCNAAVDNHNGNLFDTMVTEKAEINCSDTVLGEDSDDVKQRILKQIKGKKTNDTGNLSQNLKVALGLQYDTTHNVSIEDGICNGTPCVLKKIHYMQPGAIPSCLWVQFPEKTIGRNTRKEYMHYYKKYPEVSSEWTPIWSVRRTFMFRRKAIVRQQFPLKASSAKTIHKAQGQTKSCTVVDMSSGSRPHHHYVAFSRVTSIKGLYLLNGLNGKIQVDHRVVDEMKRLRAERTVDLSYEPCGDGFHQLSVVFQNAQSLRLHFPLIRNDSTFTGSDVICLAETRLHCHDPDSEFTIEGFLPIIRCDQSASYGVRPPHGLAMYVKQSLELCHVETISTKEFECLIVQLKRPSSLQLTTIITVYKSPSCIFEKFKEHVFSMARFPISDDLIVVGDFNYDVSRNQNGNFLHFMKSIFPKTKCLDTSPTTRDLTKLDLCFTTFDSASTRIITCVWSYHHTLVVSLF